MAKFLGAIPEASHGSATRLRRAVPARASRRAPGPVSYTHLRHVPDALDRAHRSTAIFMNDQGHLVLWLGTRRKSVDGQNLIFYPDGENLRRPWNFLSRERSFFREKCRFARDLPPPAAVSRTAGGSRRRGIGEIARRPPSRAKPAPAPRSGRRVRPRLDPDPPAMAADHVAGLLHPQLAVMPQAVQAAQLPQQVVHARLGRHAGAIAFQPVAQHVDLARRRQLAPGRQRKADACLLYTSRCV